jgi:hypothetical protein
LIGITKCHSWHSWYCRTQSWDYNSSSRCIWRDII